MVDLVQTDTPISPASPAERWWAQTPASSASTVAYIPPTAGDVSLGFAIPALTVIDVVEELVTTGRASHPFLGLRSTSLTRELSRRFDLGVSESVLVLDLVDGAPAHGAGIERGDVIVALDGHRIDDIGGFLGRLGKFDPGENVTVGIVRDRQRRNVAVTLGNSAPE